MDLLFSKGIYCMFFNHEKDSINFLISKVGKSLVTFQLYKRKFDINVNFESRESDFSISRKHKDFTIKVRTLSKREYLPLGKSDFTSFDYIIACINILHSPEYYIVPTTSNVDIQGTDRPYIKLTDLDKFKDKWSLIK